MKDVSIHLLFLVGNSVLCDLNVATVMLGTPRLTGFGFFFFRVFETTLVALIQDSLPTLYWCDHKKNYIHE